MEGDHLAVPVRDDLDLDVTGGVEVALQEHGVVAECGPGLPPRRTDCVPEVLRRSHDAHPFPSTPGTGLNHDRVADALGAGSCLVGAQSGEVDTVENRDTRRLGHGLRLQLRPHGRDRPRRGPDPHDAGLRHRPCELWVLGEESVTGMNRIGAGLIRCAQQCVDIEVGLECGRSRQSDGLICLHHVGLARVGVRIDGHRLYRHGTTGADHAPGDLPAVGHQDSPDHRASRLTREPTTGSGRQTGVPFRV